METIEARVHEAKAAWLKGLSLERSGDLTAAYVCYRAAHDLVVDCPQMHMTAHRHLKRINLKRRDYRELLTDVFLLGFSSIGVFELVAYLMKGKVLGSVLCTRRGADARA